MVIIAGTCIYLRHKIIHSNRFFKSVKRNTTEKQKAAKVGRLIEILEEQLKPTLSVFIAGGIDAMFNIFLIIIILLGSIFGFETLIQNNVTLAIRLCQYCSHAVVYALRDKYIGKEIKDLYAKIKGPKKSKVIMLNRQ